ncbi:MAG: hypothetical protein OCD76_01665 [Reichenbachiella sp.]
MKTRSLIVFVFAALISTASFAQKGSVAKAESYLTKLDYVSAKAEIDVAITIEKTAGKSRTWFTRGKIYQAIAISKDESIKAIDPDATAKCVEAYKKVVAMEKETSSYALIATTNMDQVWGEFLNSGGEAYGEKEYSLALNSFQKALLVKPEDSTTLFYAGVAAQQDEKEDLTMKYYYQMIDLGIASADVYSTNIYFERQVGAAILDSLSSNDLSDSEREGVKSRGFVYYDKALVVSRAAQVAYPGDSRFGQEEISLLLAMDKLDEAKAQLLSSIEEDPTNITLHLNLGVLYDNMGAAMASENKKEESRANYDSAKISYLKAIEIEPNNFIANFNAGVIYVNMAKEYYDVVRDMDYKQYQKTGEAKTKEADLILKQGLPFMEKACEIKPDDIDGLKALQQMYTQLKMNDKALETLDKVDALQAVQ